jgi:hypothetical protein
MIQPRWHVCARNCVCSELEQAWRLCAASRSPSCCAVACGYSRRSPVLKVGFRAVARRAARCVRCRSFSRSARLRSRKRRQRASRSGVVPDRDAGSVMKRQGLRLLANPSSSPNSRHRRSFVLRELAEVVELLSPELKHAAERRFDEDSPPTIGFCGKRQERQAAGIAGAKMIHAHMLSGS